MIGLILLGNNTVTLFYNFWHYYIEKDETYPAAQLFGYAVLYVALAIAVVITIAARNRGLITSGILFNFWLLLAICGIPEFRYKLDSYYTSTPVKIFFGTFSFVFKLKFF